MVRWVDGWMDGWVDGKGSLSFQRRSFHLLTQHQHHKQVNMRVPAMEVQTPQVAQGVAVRLPL